MLQNKKIFIFGGSGSLGLKLIEKYLDNNKIYVYSRDESKHWKINLDYNFHKNLNFIIGDIRDSDKVQQSLVRHKPEIIIIAAALKHIDKCEYETNEAIGTNLIGVKNILDNIEKYQDHLGNLETVLFVSTDKACSPVNAYGMCKALSEVLIIEKSKYISDIKFVNVRYGNVLNSRGSIIPILHNIGKNANIKSFSLTDSRMTRFVMTLEQSVELIEYAILYGESGDTIIPKLISMKVHDLFKIFSNLYNKPIEITEIRPGEKLFESLINETQSYRLINKDNGYFHIKPNYKTIENCSNKELKDYNSHINPLSKDELSHYLKTLNLV